MCPRGNPSALWLVPGHSTSTVPAAPLADPPASAPWRAGAPLAPLSLWPAAPVAFALLLVMQPQAGGRSGVAVWRTLPKDAAAALPWGRQAAGTQNQHSQVREQRWVHQPPGLPEDDALPSHRPRPEAQRAVLDRRTPLAQSFISRKALHNTCHLMSSKAVPLPY